MNIAFSAFLTLGLAGLCSAQVSADLAKGARPDKDPNAPLNFPPSTVGGGAFFGGGDDCSLAVPIMGAQTIPFDTTNATTTLFTGGGGCGAGADSINQDVFWQWTATAAGDYIITTCGLATWDTKLSAHAGVGCLATCVAYNDDACGLQSKIGLVGVMPGDTFLIQAGGFGSNFGAGMLSIDLDPCFLTTPDMFEDNDDCPAAVPTGDGQYNTLGVSKLDWDYHEVTVADGGTLTVDLFFTHANGDVDVFLYETGACATFAQGNVGTAGSLVSGFSASDDESISWTNVTGADVTYSLKINVYPPTATGDCNTYDLVIGGTTTAGVGTNYCVASSNSVSASGSEMSATGTNSLSAMDLVLVADNAPTQPALFYFGPTQVLLAFGNGFRCVGGQVIRMPVVGGSGGVFTYPVDFGTYGGSLASMGTVNFQCWYRDPAAGGANFNLSDALQVVFVP